MDAAWRAQTFCARNFAYDVQIRAGEPAGAEEMPQTLSINTRLQAEPSVPSDPQLLSRVFTMPDLTEPGTPLSAAEITFFKTHGFLVKAGLLDNTRMAQAMDHLWTHLQSHVPVAPGSNWRLQRDEPASWVNPQWAEMPEHPRSGPFEGRQPIEYYGRIVKMHDIGAAPWLLDLVPNDPGVRQIARLLLGDTLRASTVTRGVYPVFPTRNPDDPTGARRCTGESLGPHVDQVCQQLNVCAYLCDVGPRGGGFTVYPGSHAIMYGQHELEANWSPRASFKTTLARVAREIEPLEVVADAGAVIFWHGRCVHSSGIHTADTIRWALFDDFTEDRAVLGEAEHRAAGQYEWFKNAKLFADDHAVGDNMWRHWRLGA